LFWKTFIHSGSLTFWRWSRAPLHTPLPSSERMIYISWRDGRLSWPGRLVIY